MRLYEEDTVTVSAGRSRVLVERKATTPNLPPPEIVEFPHTGRLVEAELAGDGFRIEAASKATIQDIDDPDEPAVWTWFVTPQEPGKHGLVLSICFHSTVDGTDARRCDPSQQRQIDVVVTGVMPRLKYLLAEYQWLYAVLPAGMAAGIGSWVWARLSKKRNGGRPRGGSNPRSTDPEEAPRSTG